MVENFFSKKFLEISLFLFFVSIRFARKFPCTLPTNRWTILWASSESLRELWDKLWGHDWEKTENWKKSFFLEKKGFFGMTKDLFGKTSDEKSAKNIELCTCAKFQPNPTDSFWDRTQKFTFWIWLLFSSALDLGIGALPIPQNNFWGFPHSPSNTDLMKSHTKDHNIV